MGAETAFLVPSTKGLIIRDPKTRAPLPETGGLKPMLGPLGRYWRRRLRDGSVVIGQLPIQKPPVVPKEETVAKRKYGKEKEE